MPFYVGDGGNIYGDETWNGRLYFAYNDFPDLFGDNWGYYVIKVIRYHRTISGASPAPDPLPGMRSLTAVPNPFAASAAIGFSLAAAGPARVDVFDAGGRVVRTLLDEVVTAGMRSVVWDGLDASGRKVPSGTYFCRVFSGGKQLAEKIVVAR